MNSIARCQRRSMCHLLAAGPIPSSTAAPPGASLTVSPPDPTSRPQPTPNPLSSSGPSAWVNEPWRQLVFLFSDLRVIDRMRDWPRGWPRPPRPRSRKGTTSPEARLPKGVAPRRPHPKAPALLPLGQSEGAVGRRHRCRPLHRACDTVAMAADENNQAPLVGPELRCSAGRRSGPREKGSARLLAEP